MFILSEELVKVFRDSQKSTRDEFNDSICFTRNNLLYAILRSEDLKITQLFELLINYGLNKEDT